MARSCAKNKTVDDSQTMLFYEVENNTGGFFFSLLLKHVSYGSLCLSKATN